MKWATEWIAILYTFAYFAMVGCIMIVPNVNEPPSSLLGIMSAAQLAIIQYYFGASKLQDTQNQSPKAVAAVTVEQPKP